MIHTKENTDYDIRVTRLLWFAIGFLVAIAIAIIILWIN